jgi:putative flippase GtrA
VLRFAAVGGIASALQVALLALLTRYGWDALLANVVAFVIAAQVNFALSATVTWRDRARGAPLGHRWALFHGSIAGTAVLNQVVFILARLALPALLASAAGSAAAAIGNYLLGDRLVFRGQAQGAQGPQSRLQDGAAA